MTYNSAKQNHVKPAGSLIRHILVVIFAMASMIAALTAYTSMTASAASIHVATYAGLKSAVEDATYYDEIIIDNNLTAGSGDGVIAITRTHTFKANSGSVTITQANSATRHFSVAGTNSLTFENVILDGGNAGGGIATLSGSSVTLGGAYIQNCDGGNYGGAVYANGTSFSLSGSTITSNTAAQGGGIYINAGAFSLLGGTVSYNTATITSGGGGGGIAFAGTVCTLSGGSINNNRSYNNGGGIYCTGNIGTNSISNTIMNNINSLIVSNNRADAYGGGIYSSNLSDLEMYGGTVSYNSASQGGGIYNMGSSSSAVDFFMSGGLISNNQTTYQGGGGVVMNEADFSMSGGEINYNTAITVGGGVYFYGDSNMQFTMSSAVIKGNSSISHGGGVFLSNNDKFTISQSSYITDNKSTSSSAGYGGGIYFSGGNSGSISYSYLSGNSAMQGGAFYVANNVGGCNISVTYSYLYGNSTTVQSGAGFVLNSSNGVLNLTNCEIKNNSSKSNGGGIYLYLGSLSLELCEIAGNDAVNEGGGLYAPSGSASLALTSNSFEANGSRDGGGMYYAASGTLVFGGSNTFRNNASNRNGGGIYLANGSATTLSNCTIELNTAATNGGGIYTSKEITISNGAIDANKAGTHGGGIYTTNRITISDGMITNNTATSGDGGGMYVTSLTNIQPMVTAGTGFSGNTASRAAPNITAADILVHDARILTTSRSIFPDTGLPFDYLFNNFDVNYLNYKVSGKLIGGSPGGLTVDYDINGTLFTTTADAAGEYHFYVRPGDAVNIEPPHQPGYSVSPEYRGYSNIVANITNADFTYLNYTLLVDDSVSGSMWSTAVSIQGSLSVTFRSGATTQTAFFSPSVMKYTGAASSDMIVPLTAGTWDVTMNLPEGYGYNLYLNGVQVASNSLTITSADLLQDCEIKVVIVDEPYILAWGKRILKFLGYDTHYIYP